MATSDPDAIASINGHGLSSDSELNDAIANAIAKKNETGHHTRSLAKILASGDPVILDGGLATYLESLGADISGALWSASLLLEKPELIYQTHLDYFKAGAEVAITASYQASIAGLEKHLQLPSDAAADLVKKSVTLAQQARADYLDSLPDLEKESKSKRLLVAGSVGPYGAFLANGSEYTGAYDPSPFPNQFKDWHRGRIAALVDAGIDVLAIETLPSLPETEALVELLADDFPDVHAWFSFTLKNEFHISDGTSLSLVTCLLNGNPQVVAVGVNCCAEEMALGALKELKVLSTIPLLVYPNSGEAWDAENRTWTGKRKEGEGLAERTREWWSAGARLIGGCCRTTPEDVRVIARALTGLKDQKP